MRDEPLDAASDDDLLARVASGQVEAFAALFRRRQAVVYRFALHMTGAPSAADDITQEVFLAVMRDAGRYQPNRSGATAWLCGIARNHARRRLEGDRRTVPLEGDGGDSEWAAVGLDPLEDLTRAEGIASLRSAILTLPLRYREVVVLCDLQELTYAVAADALGCAVGTVRSRLHRGRALLAAKLTQSRVDAPADGTRLQSGDDRLQPDDRAQREDKRLRDEHPRRASARGIA
jgi:RNA polymerase sigma-70 factor, ECF subfamily